LCVSKKGTYRAAGEKEKKNSGIAEAKNGGNLITRDYIGAKSKPTREKGNKLNDAKKKEITRVRRPRKKKEGNAKRAQTFRNPPTRR